MSTCQDFDCDVFFPELDSARWRLWSSSAPRTEGSVRYEFQVYVPAASTAAPQLSPAVASRHEELQV